MIKTDVPKLGEERFQNMIAELEDYAIFLLDTEGIICTWNKGAEAIKGYRADEAIGRSFKIFYAHKDRTDGLPDQLLNSARRDGKVNHEGWRVRKDGTEFWGNVTITALHNEKGEVTGFLKVTRDLTERRKAEERMQTYVAQLEKNNQAVSQSEERYQKMVSEVKDYAIILMDTDGVVLDWNKGATDIKGYRADEIIGKNFRLFYPLGDVQAKLPESLLEEARRSGRATHEGWRVRKDGSNFWGSVVITALHDDAGQVIGFTKVTRDLTDRKHAEDSLKKSAKLLDQKNKALERLNNELSSFVYVASHDMKEPLRKIQTYISMFNEPLSDRGKNVLDKISRSAARMQNLIEDLLSYSHVSNDSSKTEILDLNEIVETVKHDLELQIMQKDAVIEVEQLPAIEGIRFQIYQVFLNLLSNALKFSREGVKPRIDIRVNHSAENNSRAQTLRINVIDNGIGIASENLQRIFEVFQRLHPKQTYSGTGIGLAIVKKVMENHKGNVTAESKVGEGSVFQLSFPARQLSIPQRHCSL